MANELFDRRWAVTVGPPGQAGRRWEDLRVSFTVEKTGSAMPNTLKLELTNLSADSRAYVLKKGLAVRVEAGYEATGVRLLFTGTLEKASHARNELTWATRIESADGVAAYRSTYLSETLGPGTSERQAIAHVAKALGVTLGEIKGLGEETFAHGRALSGPARLELDALCRSRKLRWSIQDGVLQILPASDALSQESWLLSPATGLVGVPERTEKGVKLVSLLQGGINPGRRVKVEAHALPGLYVVQAVTHRGDSHGQDWYTEIEAKPAS